MKNLITALFLSFLFIPGSIFSQSNYEITVIDSFQWTDYSGAGVVGADAAEHEGKIFLSYYYRPNASGNRYVIFAEKNNGSFSFDTVATFGYVHYTVAMATAIQIDNNNNPWVYYLYGGDIWASRKIDGVWITDQIWASDTYDTDGVATIDGGGDGIGLFQCGKNPINNKYALMYTYWKNGNWNTDVLYETSHHWRSGRISAENVGNDLYLSFVTSTSTSPDSFYVHVLKESNSAWTEDFTDLVTGESGGVYISEKGLLGKSPNGNLFLWREYGQSDLGENAGARLFEKTTSGWQRIQFTSPPNGLMAWPRGSNLAITNSEIVCAISEGNGSDSKLSWAETDGTSGLNEELPHWEWNPFTIGLCDIITVDDYIYIYYTNGAAGNYNYPVTFKEAKININDLITDVNYNESSVPNKYELYQNFPNPFNPSTTIEYSIPAVGDEYIRPTNNVTLKIYDILGEEITTLVNKKQTPGNYEVKFNAGNLSSGIYFYRLKAGNFSKTNKMILLK